LRQRERPWDDVYSLTDSAAVLAETAIVAELIDSESREGVEP
jgi:hypothetical protein